MQSYDVPFKIEEINFDNLIYKDIKSNSRKTVVFLKYKKKNTLKNFVIQTPSFLNINKAETSNGKHYDLDIPLYGKRDDKVKEFVNFLKKLDEKIIFDAKINSSAWFNNFDITEEINYQEIIRKSDNKKFNNGIFRVKIIKNDDFNTMLQINNQAKINPDSIPVNSWVKMIIEVQAIWINKNGFGLFLKPILISFNPIEIKKYRFIDDSEDEVDDIIDSENSVFINAEKKDSNQNEETSVLRINSVEDSLEIESKKNFSSTSSDDDEISPSNENKTL